MNGLEGVIYFDNTKKDFYVDRTSSIDPGEEECLIYHSGNFDPDTKEDHLGNPVSDGMILSSQADGTRQWIPNTSQVSMSRSRFTGDGVTTEFDVIPYVPHNADVYYNGVKLLEPEDIDLSTGTKVIFTTAPEQDDIIEFVGYDIPLITGIVDGDYVYYTYDPDDGYLTKDGIRYVKDNGRNLAEGGE
jgi:hypothetical protein